MPVNREVCSLCSGNLARIRRFSKRGREDIHLYRCMDCRSEMLLPQPTDGLLAKEYKDYFSKRSQYTSTPFPKVTFFTDLLKKHFPLTSYTPDFKALELGSGGGDFVAAFNTLFPQAAITAVEMNTEGADKLRGLNCRVVNIAIEDFLEDCVDRYDSIFMFDVLEHLRSPVESLRRLSRLLKADGRIYLTTPLAGSMLHRLTGRFWPQYKLEHLFYFSKTSFDKIGEQVGLRTEKSIALSKTLPISYLLSVGSNFGPKVFTRLVDYGSKILPGSLYERRVRLPLGEVLVVYGKRG
jgi:SAM-dependent methyltransferase